MFSIVFKKLVSVVNYTLMMLRLKVIPQMGFYKILLTLNCRNRFIHFILWM